MKNTWKWIVALGMSFLYGNLPMCYAQDLMFSQYLQNPFLTNASLIATQQKGQIFMQYRNQPLASGDQWQSTMFYSDLAFARANKPHPFMGLGLMFLRENIGSFLTTQGIAIAHNYQLSIKDRHRVGLGGQLGWFQQRFNTDEITTDNQFLAGFFDPEASLNENFDNTQASYFTARLAAHWAYFDALGYQRFHVGIAWNNLNRPTLDLLATEASRLPAHTAVYAHSILFNPLKFTIEPNLLWIHRLNQSFVQLGTWLRYPLRITTQNNESLALGAWYHSNGASVMAVEWQHSKYVLGMSYDLPINDAANNWLGSGAIEFRLGIKLAPHYTPKKRLEIQEPIRDTFALLERKQMIDTFTNTFSLPALDIAPLLARQKQLLNQNTLSPDKTQSNDNEEGLFLRTLPEDVRLLNAQHVRFDLSQDTLSQNYLNYLNKVVEVLLRYPQLHLIITGHTCNIGDYDKNILLSEERAKYVKNSLINRGINESRIITLGLGSSVPLVPNSYEANRQKNRRVEFEFILTD